MMNWTKWTAEKKRVIYDRFLWLDDSHISEFISFRTMEEYIFSKS